MPLDQPMDWPPDYTSVYIHKQKVLRAFRKNLAGAQEFYRTHPIEWIEDFAETYDPRNASGTGLTRMPFILFPRQAEMVTFLQDCLVGNHDGLVEKCRDAGATWICCAFSVWLWLYRDGASVGWGSRKEQLVDKIGDPDSIFEKMRMIIDALPAEMLPVGFSLKDHCTYMKIINPQTGATITGESGDNIGRGGRKLIYFKDESAHYERAEKIESALGDNTNCQIDISSVNGTGNVFHRRRMAGKLWPEEMEPGGVAVFIMDWRDHPSKTVEWYNRRKRQAEEKGLLHLFAQEVDRDYSASVDGIVVPASWVKSAIDAHKVLGIEPTGLKVSALDVADEGGDKNALVKRYGFLLEGADDWGEGDTTQTAHRAVEASRGADELYYDSIGVGAGVKGATNEMGRLGQLPSRLKIFPWSASSSVLEPERNVIPGDLHTPLNKDFYLNLKAQGWWLLRCRFERTHNAVTAVSNGEQPHLNSDELISISSDIAKLHQLCDELSQPTFSRNAAGKITIDKAPSGMRSPNLADAVVMAFCPTRQRSIYDVI